MAPLSDSQPLNVAVNVDEEKQQEFYSAYASSEFYADTRVSVYENGTDTLSVAREVVAMKAVQEDTRPFFVMDMGSVDSRVANWFIHLPDVHPFYSLRCNWDPVLLQLLADRGIGFSCSSRQELDIALKYVSTEQIVYSDTLWTRANIRYAREKGVSTVVIESEDDLNRFGMYYPTAKFDFVPQYPDSSLVIPLIILRVSVTPTVECGPLCSEGADLRRADGLFNMAANLGFRIFGLSFAIQAETPSAIIYAYAVAQARRFYDAASTFGHHPSVLDIGGGFPGTDGGKGASFEQISAMIKQAVGIFFPKSTHKHVQIIAEPGRYFAAPLYSLVTNITDKQVIDASELTGDGADAGLTGYIYQINEGFYGSFGCCLNSKCDPKCRPLAAHDDKVTTYASVVGPTICERDVVLRLARIPQMQIGEWLLWNNMGAYTMGNCASLNDELPALTVHYFVGIARWKLMSRSPSPLNVLENNKQTTLHAVECSSNEDYTGECGFFSTEYIDMKTTASFEVTTHEAWTLSESECFLL